LPAGSGAPAVLGWTAAASGAVALALGELAGDKMRSAPYRTAVPGLAARLATGAIAGAALAPRERRISAGALGALAAVASSYLTLNLRMRALRRFGQTRSGLVEDALVAGATALIVGTAPARA
jgi:uncharacterized membrane protein